MTAEPATDEIGIANDGHGIAVAHPLPQLIQGRLVIDDRTRLEEPRSEGSAGGSLEPEHAPVAPSIRSVATRKGPFMRTF